jgi:diadenylate cyclase
MKLFNIGFLPIELLDIVDISIVALIFYMVYNRIKDTRAMQLISGLLVVLALSIAAGWLHLEALRTLLEYFGSVWLIALVVIFAPELRRLLIQIGRIRGLSFFNHQAEQHSIDEVVTAARRLSEKQFGAIIVISRNTQLGVVVDTGATIDAVVSYQLLLAIFNPGNPLHDLAVVIRGNRITAANCLLPLTESADIDRALGSRHRAAVGITEETDAVTVVVSEETRAISLAVDGRLLRNLSPADLRTNLISLLG